MELEKKKENNERLINYGIMKRRDIRILFDQEDYYEPRRANKFWNNNYIKYKNNGDKNRNLSLDEYLNKIGTYLRNIIVNLQNSDTWKVQLTIAISFISSKDTEEEHVMHLNKDDIKFTSYNDANELVNKLFKSLHSKYQENLETSMKGNDFNFDSVQLLYFQYHIVNFKHGGSYIDSPGWIKKKKATINPKNEDMFSKCSNCCIKLLRN